MKKSRFLIKTAAITIALTLSSASMVFADTFKDVPSTHWAYESIGKIASQGIIVGDLSGNFKPDAYIDKFETSKILAKLAGYKYSNISESERLYYDRVYENNKSFLNQYAKAFKKWNPTADREIAYLLEKQILRSDDLNQFVIKSPSGTEQLRALSREEASVFLVRIMGKETEANSLNIQDPFIDDATITTNRKSSVYYLRSIGVITGGSDTRFNPKGAVTKATMSVMIDKVQQEMNKTTPGGNSQIENNVSSISPNVNNISTIRGTLDKTFPSLSVLQINENGVQKLYKISNAASIKVDNYLRTINDLQQGMNITAIVNNSEIIELNALSTQGNVQGNPSDNQNNVTNPDNATNNGNINGNINTGNTGNTSLPSTDNTTDTSNYTTIEGTVSALNDTTTRTISIDFKIVNPRGEIINQTKTYNVSNNCEVMRGFNRSDFSSIVINDIVSAKVLGNTVYSIELDEKDKEFNGTLIEKKYSDTNSLPMLVIESETGKTYSLNVTGKTIISRKSKGDVEWNDLRIGDKVEVKAVYNDIEEIFATGSKSSVEGKVKAIHILEDYSSIDLIEGNKTKTYPLIMSQVDPYTVKIGDTVKLRLDSSEVEDIHVTRKSDNNNLIGYVEDVKRNYITISDTSMGTVKVYYGKDTVFVNSINGKKISSDDIDDGMKVYIVLGNSISDDAKSITLLSKK